MNKESAVARKRADEEPAPSERVETRLRVVTATALFDGHDAAINLIRRALQNAGAEVIHLGHNRSVHEIVTAAIQEDVHAVVVSSYQGGHNEFFPYLREELDRHGGARIQIYGGGGGVVLPAEVEALEAKGIRKIFTPEDGRRLGIHGMAQLLFDSREDLPMEVSAASRDALLARALTAIEIGQDASAITGRLKEKRDTSTIVGLTGPGGAGKSSLVDELVLRFTRDFRDLHIGVLSVDPTRKRTGGALLGDRLRMNAIYGGRVFFRSFATRESGTELSLALERAIELYRQAGFSLLLIETAGIGQGSSAVVDISDLSLYVMTPEYGAPSQLEKIDMFDFADLVVVNKMDRQAGEDARTSVERQLRCLGREGIHEQVYGTCASNFADSGVDTVYAALVKAIGKQDGALSVGASIEESKGPGAFAVRILDRGREAYLSEAARVVRRYHEKTDAESRAIRALDGARATLSELEKSADLNAESIRQVKALIGKLEASVDPGTLRLLDDWEAVARAYAEDELVYPVRDREIRVPLVWTSLSGTRIPRVALPRFPDRGEQLRFLRLENLPGHFPYTAGVFPLRRRDEHPTRQFAGEGTPERTNERFHLLSRGQPAIRLSTAFDSVTLYGADPDPRPDIYGKVGESGVSIASWEDMSRLFRGFDLCDPSTSVSMTINGPAPAILAMYFNAAIEQQVEKHTRETGTTPNHQERERIGDGVLRSARGTVQADILKEDQAQNTCLFSTAFSLKMMGDVQEYFIAKDVRNFYSVSISGYHIAEAGANPITQLAFTLANGLTYVEYYLSRGMNVDAFARNLSFFFSMGMDPEYAVLGRVARRIWSVVMRERYGAAARSQKLKYHIQTSGRSLHAREMAFNDIRTTLQALAAYYDQCNSLHTNAYDEAITTPTEESVRRAVAIQLIVQKELGTAQVENPLQGSFVIDELTDLVEEAVLAEFERISRRGGIPGAMESGYLRGKIQEESRVYEERKFSGELPVVGVNTFLVDDDSSTASGSDKVAPASVVRATTEEKERQISNLRDFQKRSVNNAPAALERLQRAARAGENTFEVLMDTVRHASLGQITRALFEVGGAYRRMI